MKDFGDFVDQTTGNSETALGLGQRKMLDWVAGSGDRIGSEYLPEFRWMQVMCVNQSSQSDLKSQPIYEELVGRAERCSQPVPCCGLEGYRGSRRMEFQLCFAAVVTDCSCRLRKL